MVRVGVDFVPLQRVLLEAHLVRYGLSHTLNISLWLYFVYIEFLYEQGFDCICRPSTEIGVRISDPLGYFR
jgi:hypothetical protein